MHQAPQQHERMALPQTKPQQTGSSRPNHVSHNQENSIRPRPGGTRALPENHRKSHHQDREQGDVDLMKSLPRQPKQRKPLQSIDHNAEQWTAPRGPRQHRAPGSEASVESLQMEQHLSNMYTMIDDHLAWNMSASNVAYYSPESPRPTSSGTMFVDFGSDGEVEVSYRNGVNKKLPTPPFPSKTPTPAKPTIPRKAVNNKDIQPKPQRGEIKQAQPNPHPSHSSRHDSVISATAQPSDYTNPLLAPPFPPPNRPLPPLPTQAPMHTHSRRSYPPQVHTTSRSVTATKVHSSPALTTASTSTYHTARDVETCENALYTVIEPKGRTSSNHPASSQTVQHSPYPDSRRASLAPSRTDTYKEVFPHPSAYTHSSTSVPLQKLDTNKPLPPLPPANRDFSCHGTRCEGPVLLKKEQKRSKLFSFVRKMLRKMGGFSDEFNEHQHRHEHVEKRR